MKKTNTTDREVIRVEEVRRITGLKGKEPYRKAKDPNDPFPTGLPPMKWST